MTDLKSFLAGGGEMGDRIRAHDWESTPPGPIGSWPQSLRSALSICLRSEIGSAIFWGEELAGQAGMGFDLEGLVCRIEAPLAEAAADQP